MIRDDGLVKLTDFGIAQIVDQERMTVTGQLLGSPAYMAPEHVEGRPLDFRTDVFAVGIVTYQLATGQLPFRGKNPHEVLEAHRRVQVQPTRRGQPARSASGSAGSSGARWQREPDDRYPDVGEMRRELLEDLADAGIDDPRAELARYFADPRPGTRRRSEPRLVDGADRAAGKAARGGRTHRGRARAVGPRADASSRRTRSCARSSTASQRGRGASGD